MALSIYIFMICCVACFSLAYVIGLVFRVIGLESQLKDFRESVRLLRANKINAINMQQSLLAEGLIQEESLSELAFAWLQQAKELKTAKEKAAMRLDRHEIAVRTYREALSELSHDWRERDLRDSARIKKLEKELSSAREHAYALAASSGRLAEKLRMVTAK